MACVLYLAANFLGLVTLDVPHVHAPDEVLEDRVLRDPEAARGL